MNKFLFCAISFGASALYLYTDCINRKKFNKFLGGEKDVSSGEITTGVISHGGIHDGKYLFSKYTPFLNPINNVKMFNEYAILQTEIMSKFTFKYNDYRFIKYNDLYIQPQISTRTLVYWKNTYKNIWIAPGIIFDNQYSLIIPPTCKIFFSGNEKKNITKDSMRKNKFIKNNERITIFGKKENNCYNVFYMGSHTKVINEIAYQHYGISNTATTLSVFALILSPLLAFY